MLAFLRDLRQPPNKDIYWPLHELYSVSWPNSSEVLELGSGCGIVGIGFAQLFDNCNVLLTDLPEAMEVLYCNINQARPASGSQLFKVSLDWDNDLPTAMAERRYDVVLVSDCTYNSDSIPSLVRTLCALTRNSLGVFIIVSMKVRHSSESVFFDMMDDAGFRVQNEVRFPMPDRHRSLSGQELENVEIYIFRNARWVEDVAIDHQALIQYNKTQRENSRKT